MRSEESPQPSFSSTRRWMIMLNTALAVGAALALVAMANYLSNSHFKRSFWSRDAAFRLSPRTLHILNSLTNDVSITVFFQPNGENQEIYALTTALLAEYENANPHHIHLKTLDYSRAVGEAKELLSKNRLSGLAEKDFVLFESGGHHKTAYARELANYDFGDLLSGRSKYVRRSAFKGEMVFTADIYDVSYPQSLKTYFLYGHGENNPGDPKGGDTKLGLNGYSKLAAMLKNEVGSDWDRLSLEGTNTVPADCQLLIIAGPRQGKFPPQELGKIAAYLKQGGRLLALLTVDCGLEPVLADWGVRLGNSRVVDQDKRYNLDGQTFFTCTLFPHPIVNPLASEQMGIRMVFPRPIFTNTDGGVKIPGGPEVSLLAATSPEGMDETKHTGEFALLAAVEQGVIQGVNSSRGGTRMVVAGDSDFLDDQVIDSWAGNSYFAMSALNWLLERPQLLLSGLGPQPIQEYKLYMTHAQQQAVQWIFLAGMPGAVLALGGLVWLRRRH